MTTLLTSDPSTLVTILGVTATLLLLANILQAVVAISKKGQVQDTLLELHHAYKERDKAVWERDVAKAEKQMANQLRDRIEKAAKVVEAERDEWKRLEFKAQQEKSQWQRATENLMEERATLYFRNSKGQIEPITPKERKPHTLKHGMTVKEPSPYQAKRIFAAARRAGIETHQSATNDTNCIWFYGNDRVNSVCAAYAGAAMTTYISARFITAREFLRRIKGEIE
jgi:hypothetical protein